MSSSSKVRRSRRGPEAGVVLLLLSGVMLLLLAVGTMFLGVARSFAAGGTARISTAVADLSAASGMEYAAARLFRFGYPRFTCASRDRGDDWGFPGGNGVSIPEAPRVSFSHGEGWLDDGDGVHEPGEPFLDADADGRHSDWSGRLRGGARSCGATFSLKVSSLEAGIPVNVRGPLPGLRLALDNLGAILRPMADGPWHRRYDVPSGASGTLDGEKIEVSWLGYDLLKGRPPKGYESLKQVEAYLLDEGYGEEEVSLFLPFLDLGPYEQADAGNRPKVWSDTTRPDAYAPVLFATASTEVLQSLWRYLTGPVHMAPQGIGPKRYRRSGPANLTFQQTDGSMKKWGMLCTIFPDEASALALAADEVRQAGGYSWRALRKGLSGKALEMFIRDAADLDPDLDGDGNSLTSPSPAQRAWTRAKADLAFYAVSPDPCPWSAVPAAYAHGGVDLDPSTGGTEPFSALIARFIGRVPFPPPYFSGYPSGSSNVPYQLKSSSACWPADGQGLTLCPSLGLEMSPPTRYAVDCRGEVRGALRRASAERAAEFMGSLDRILLFSQEDFENLEGGAELRARTGIEAEDPVPHEKRAWMLDPESGRRYPHVKSYPRYNPSRVPWRRYSRHHGGVGLADRELGSRGAELYIPFSEDLDGDEVDDLQTEPPALSFPFPVPDTEAGIAASGPWWATYPGTINPALPFLKSPDIFTHEELPEGAFEAWMFPLSPRSGTVFPADQCSALAIRGQIETDNSSASAECSIHAKRYPGGVRFKVKLKHITYRTALTSGLGPDYICEKDVDVEDLQADEGSYQSGHYHALLTFRKVPLSESGGLEKSLFRFYVNGTKRLEWVYPDGDSEGYPYRFSWLWMKMEMVDEVRLDDGFAEDDEAKARYRLGRFVPPRQAKAPDPEDLLKESPDVPPNPTYRSPRYRLGRGSRLRLGSWNGLTTGPFELDALVRMRMVVFGYDGAGSLLGTVECPASGVPEDLSGIGPVASFRYAVEFYSPSGSLPAVPLRDTPVLESAWFTLQRPGRSPYWTGWRAPR